MIEVKTSGAKGLGVFAIADIPRGTRVIAEAGLLKIDRNKINANTIVLAFESLPAAQKTTYLELHGFACDAFKRATEHDIGMAWQDLPELCCRILSIWQANTFGDVFPLASRINHSCVPNINFAYNSLLEMETFNAVRDIAAGEELTIMYINGVSRTHTQRQAELDKWGFTCTCPACDTTVPGWQEKEDKRAQLFMHDQKLAFSTRRKDWDQALKSAQSLAAIQHSEGFLVREISRS